MGLDAFFRLAVRPMTAVLALPVIFVMVGVLTDSSSFSFDLLLPMMVGQWAGLPFTKSFAVPSPGPCLACAPGCSGRSC